MTDDILNRLRAVMKRRAERPPRVQFFEMVADGSIDEEGRVLLMRPRDPTPCYSFATRLRAYKDCEPAVQRVIDELVNIVNDPTCDNDDRVMAADTMHEALFGRRIKVSARDTSRD